jgi:thiosulfate dehydrogenase [quinone] large subunit
MTTSKVNRKTKVAADTLRQRPSLSMVGLLIVQIIIGYEWFVSGLTKIVRGDFTSGLADEMTQKLADSPGWYAEILNSVVIPNASIFGYLIEFGELLIGIVFIGGALLWLFAWDRIADRMREVSLFLVSIAAIAAIFMALNFHFANGYSHPWLLPIDSFDEGVDFDTFLVAMNTVIAVFNILFLKNLRQEKVNTGTKQGTLV